jgi:hypothetical protein
MEKKKNVFSLRSIVINLSDVLSLYSHHQVNPVSESKSVHNKLHISARLITMKTEKRETT